MYIIPMRESARMAPSMGVRKATTVKPWNRTEASVSLNPITLVTNRTRIAEHGGKLNSV